jgi:DNA-binding YbaB/EbfC family protein
LTIFCPQPRLTAIELKRRLTMRANYPKGMGGAQNMNAMLQQAQKMQEDMAALQEELEAREYEVSAGGGAVKVKINGKKQLLALDIAPEIVDPDDIETLSDILIASVNEAIKRVEDTSNDEMQKVTGAMGMPGIPGLF